MVQDGEMRHNFLCYNNVLDKFTNVINKLSENQCMPLQPGSHKQSQHTQL
jgi:hypothetical protein